jgi:hypothetical protein
VTTDLASRVRRLVEGGAQPITLEELAHRRTADGSSNKRYAVLAAGLVLVIASVVAVVTALGTDSTSGDPVLSSSKVSLTGVPQGVSVQQFGKRLSFVERGGDHITVFDTNVHHLPGENGLWWCPNEQQFVAPTHAETFTPLGKAIGGPATAGLDSFRTTVRHNKLSIDRRHLIPGAKGNAQTAAGQTGRNSVESWDSGPDSFCAGAYKAVNAPTPSSVLDVRALASIAYDQKIYTVPEGLIEVRFSGVTGILFTFDDPRYRYCFLANDRGAPHACRVYLTPGEYLIYDSVLGHQLAGYEATIHVTAPQAPPSSSSPRPPAKQARTP